VFRSWDWETLAEHPRRDREPSRGRYGPLLSELPGFVREIRLTLSLDDGAERHLRRPQCAGVLGYGMVSTLIGPELNLSGCRLIRSSVRQRELGLRRRLGGSWLVRLAFRLRRVLKRGHPVAGAKHEQADVKSGAVEVDAEQPGYPRAVFCAADTSTSSRQTGCNASSTGGRRPWSTSGNTYIP
jgi:hypothetical protein